MSSSKWLTASKSNVRLFFISYKNWLLMFVFSFSQHMDNKICEAVVMIDIKKTNIDC
nr:MAG TPA: hypothetical protein [Caudoviricetes sp.]